MIRTSSVIAALAGLGIAGAAHANDIFGFQWQEGVSADPPDLIEGTDAGTFENISTMYNPSTGTLDFHAVFSDQVTGGFTLVLTPGQFPSNAPGAHAILYFDATDMANPIMTAYGYAGGADPFFSWLDGDGRTPVDDTPDFILGNDASWVNDASAVDTPDGKRTLSFQIDASLINSHMPIYDNPDQDYEGVQFDSTLGIWFHTWLTFDGEYDEDGRITGFSRNGFGFWDATNLEAFIVPTPGVSALLLGAAAFGLRRRRV